MKRIITENPMAIYAPHETIDEREYQSHIMRFAPRIFSRCHFAQWAPLIRDYYGRGAKPDAVIINEDLDTWFIVEIELGHHSLSLHVAPQLETLSQGIYDSSLVTSLLSAFPHLSPGYINHLLDSRQPGFLCIVDDASDRFRSTCRNYEFEIVELQPYRSNDGRWAISITHLPSIFLIDVLPDRYYLRRGSTIGDRIQVFLPSVFPKWQGAVNLMDREGGSHQCAIHYQPQYSILIPRHVLSSMRSLSVSILDVDQQVVCLEEE